MRREVNDTVCPLNVLLLCMLFKLVSGKAMGAGSADTVGRRMHCAADPVAKPWAIALQFAMLKVEVVECVL